VHQDTAVDDHGRRQPAGVIVGEDRRVSVTEHREAAADPGWFSVRCIFQCDDEAPAMYEERITLWRAARFEEAIALAEAEAEDYDLRLAPGYAQNIRG
jgi:hypothetical protein